MSKAHPQRATLVGEINEARKKFLGQQVSGEVEFGRCWGAGSNRKPNQSVRVKLSDGRRAYATYTNPRLVTLIICASHA